MSDLDDLDSDESEFCECGVQHTVEELDFNLCDCCGRAINE